MTGKRGPFSVIGSRRSERRSTTGDPAIDFEGAEKASGRVGTPPSGDVMAPGDLKGPAREFWNRHAPCCAAAGLLRLETTDAFKRCCELWAATERARAALEAEGLTYRADKLNKSNPALKQFLDLTRLWAQLAADFGLTPRGRGRLGIMDAHAPIQAAKTSPPDPFNLGRPGRNADGSLKTAEQRRPRS